MNQKVRVLLEMIRDIDREKIKLEMRLRTLKEQREVLQESLDYAERETAGVEAN